MSASDNNCQPPVQVEMYASLTEQLSASSPDWNACQPQIIIASLQSRLKCMSASQNDCQPPVQIEICQPYSFNDMTTSMNWLSASSPDSNMSASQNNCQPPVQIEMCQPHSCNKENVSLQLGQIGICQLGRAVVSLMKNMLVSSCFRLRHETKW